MFELIEACGALRQPHRAGDVVVDRIAGHFPQSFVKLRRIALHAHDAPVAGKIRAIAGGVPGGTGGQLVFLQQQQVAPAPLRQMPEDAASNRAASDDDDTGMGGKAGHESGLSGALLKTSAWRLVADRARH